MGRPSSKNQAKAWSRKEIDRALESIKHIEGSITDFPLQLKEDLRRHLRKGGTDNFAGAVWGARVGTLKRKGQEEACFQLPRGAVIEELGRFRFESPIRSRQIIVAILPYSVLPCKIITWASEYLQRSRCWKIFQVANPTPTLHTISGSSPSQRDAHEKSSTQIVSMERKRSPTSSEVSLWSPLATESVDEVRHEATEILRQDVPKWHIDHGNSDSEDSHVNPVSARLRSRTNTAYDFLSMNDEVTEEEGDEKQWVNISAGFMQHASTHQADGSIAAKPYDSLAYYQRSIEELLSNKESATRNDTSQVEVTTGATSSPPADAVNIDNPSSQVSIKIEADEDEEADFKNVVFVFKDADDTEYGRTSFSSCDSQTALFDEALASGIGLSLNTRMLAVQVADLPRTLVRVDQRKIPSYESKILEPIKSLVLERGSLAKIEVFVKHYY